MAAQYIGAFLAALVLWGEYADAIKMVSSSSLLEIILANFRLKGLATILPLPMAYLPPTPTSLWIK